MLCVHMALICEVQFCSVSLSCAVWNCACISNVHSSLGADVVGIAVFATVKSSRSDTYDVI